jgi:uracil-DNA glycosylase family 4
MVFGEHPGWEEMRDGLPFVGETGMVLREELLRVDINLDSVIRSNLWMHYMPKKKAEQMEEIDFHVRQLLKLMRGAKAVLMLGDQCTRTFLGTGIGKISSLEVKIDMFPDTVETVTVSPNPAVVFKRPFGEVRLAIEKFAERAEPWL